MRRRWLLWGLAGSVAASVAASFTAPPADEADALAVVALRERKAVPPAQAAPDWPTGPRAPMNADIRNDTANGTVTATGWGAPMAVAAIAPPAPARARRTEAEAAAAVAAPAFPYRLIGRVESSGRSHALIASPARTLSVRAGDLVDRQWQVEQAADGSFSVRWLPGGQRRPLAFRPA